MMKFLPTLIGVSLLGTALMAAPSRPNVIVILADDVGFSDIGCFGSEIATPNLDALATDGLRFTEFYNTARCCPTRASLLTGLYPHQAGIGYMVDRANYSAKAMINEWYSGDLRSDVVTMAEVVRSAGYATYAVGKWHVTKNSEPDEPQDNWPLQRGFDHYYGVLPGASNYFTPKRLTRDNTSIAHDNDPEYHSDDFYLTDAFSDNAVKYIQTHANEEPEKPFFMYLAYTAAHWPIQAKPADIAKYRGRYDAGYGEIRRERLERMREEGVLDPAWELSPQFGDWESVGRKDWEARRMEVYAAMIDNMDQGIGRVIAALKANGQFENTLILYLQDNGGCAEEIGRGRKGKAKGSDVPMAGPEDSWLAYGEAWANVSNTPFRYYKHYIHEGGIATPLIAHWPQGIARTGGIDRQPGHLIDVMATLVDVAGANYPATRNGQPVPAMEGVSLVPAFSGQKLTRDAIFWEHEGNRGLRIDDWKLVAKEPNGPWELYNLKSDRSEMHDLARKQKARVAEMTATWGRWAERTHAVPWPWKPAFKAEK